jgi:branched-chain amino acid transport system ATP-binding protein
MTYDLILEARGLSKQFGEFAAVCGVNLKVVKGTIHALIGPNGAGKTTLFNLLTRFLPVSSGTILFKGKDITETQPAEVSRLGIGRSFQISSVFPHLTARENVRVGLQRKLNSTFSFWRSERELAVLHERADQLLESVGLGDFINVQAVEMPYGRKRALEIATTLALDPEMLLLDEPMAGLGTEDIQRISALIRTVAADRTVLMVEHNIGVVASLSDTITVLTRGKVLAEGPYTELSGDPRVIEAYMGTRHG